MTGHELAIWMVTHGYSNVRLGLALDITAHTICKYKRLRPPRWLPLALKTLEGMK